MSFGGSYTTGTISVSANGTSVTGSGTLWQTAQILEGDFLVAGGLIGVIAADAASETALTLSSGWAGSTLSGAAYAIIETSWKRADTTQTQADVSELVASLKAASVIFAVTGSAPDPGLGDDGQFALKVNISPWRLWERIAGEWIEQQAPVSPGGLPWTFSSTVTMADPTSGKLRLNNAAFASATGIAMSATNASGGSSSAWINRFDDSTTTAHRGVLTIKKESDATQYVQFDVTGALTDNATWLQLAVTFIDSNGSFTDGDSVSVEFARTGDLGGTGATGATGATGPVPWSPPVAWATATNYVVGPPASTVVQGGQTYVCLVAHTSGTFSTDLAAGKWELIAAKGADGAGVGDMTKAVYDTNNDGIIDYAALPIGTTSGHIAAADDARITGAVRSDTAQALTELQKRQGLSNIGSLLGFNRVLNPSGRLTQAGLASTSDATYTGFDQWLALTQSGAVTPSQLTAVEDGTPFMMRLTQAQATAQRFGFIQWMPNIDVADLRSKTVTFSARVRLSTSANVRMAIVEWAGGADVITKDIVNDWTNGTYTPGNFFTSSGTVVTAASPSQALAANTLTNLSVSGTVGSLMNNLAVFIWTEGTAAQNVTLDVGKVQLEDGLSASPHAPRPFIQELELCARAFYAYGPGVADAIGLIGGMASATTGLYYMRFMVPMLKNSPTMSLSAASDWRNNPIQSGATLQSGSSASFASASSLGTRISLVSASTGATSGVFSIMEAVNSNAKIFADARL